MINDCVTVQPLHSDYFHYQLICWSFSHQSISQNCEKRSSQLPKWRLQSAAFCPTNSPKLKDYWFTLMNDKQRQKIITLKKLQPVKVWYCCSKNDWNYWLLRGKTKTTFSQFSLHLNSFERSGLYFFSSTTAVIQLIVTALHLQSVDCVV